MARFTGPKHKLARREGVNILQKTSRSLDRRLNVMPGFHGKKGRRKMSEFGLQMREKQKLKKIYGLLEKQFQRYVRQAEKSRGNTAEALIQLLETRLDNILYRLGLAKSRTMARQFVSHRHVLVNNKKVNIPSYKVRIGDTIALASTISSNPDVKALLEVSSVLPEYIQKEGPVGKLVRLPTQEEIQNPVDYQLVIEYYSR